MRLNIRLSPLRVPILASLAALAVPLCGCSELDRSIYVNCDLKSANAFSPTETDDSEEGKIPWVRNVKSFTGKFPIGWGSKAGVFAGTDILVTEVKDTTIKGTMKYLSHLVDQPDGTQRYDATNGKLFEYTFDFNRLNDELTVMSFDKTPQIIKVRMLHFSCRRVTP